jgi:hypothetical protein
MDEAEKESAYCWKIRPSLVDFPDSQVMDKMK